MASVTDVAAYYDGFGDRLLEDYRHGNRRVEEAILFAKDALVPATSVLDVGCGIGWSSSELAADGKHVTGLDISPVLVKAARILFGDRCRFVVGDFPDTETGEFDAVLMVDVYEHFPRERWPLVHQRLRETRARLVVLTLPTPSTQEYARENGIPLQPVDEDVTDADIHGLAHDLGGTVAINRLVSVWRQDDYRHVLIEVT